MSKAFKFGTGPIRLTAPDFLTPDKIDERRTEK
jgi:hypothetical protein